MDSFPRGRPRRTTFYFENKPSIKKRYQFDGIEKTVQNDITEVLKDLQERNDLWLRCGHPKGIRFEDDGIPIFKI